MTRSPRNKTHDGLRIRCDAEHRLRPRFGVAAAKRWRTHAASALLYLSLGAKSPAAAALGAEIHVVPTTPSAVDVSAASIPSVGAIGSIGMPTSNEPQRRTAWQLAVFATRAGRVDWRCTPFVATENSRSTRDAEISVRLIAAEGAISRGGIYSARTDVAAGRESAVVSLSLEGHGTGIALVSVTMLGHADEVAADQYSSEITAHSTAH